MLFAAVAVTRGLMDAFASADSILVQPETYQLGRSMAFALMNTFCMKMAAVFMFVTSTIGLRTAVLSHWLSFVGFSFGLVLLLVIADFAWIALLFPLWVLLVIIHSVSPWEKAKSQLPNRKNRNPSRPVPRSCRTRHWRSYMQLGRASAINARASRTRPGNLPPIGRVPLP
jgi:hypothetical protein